MYLLAKMCKLFGFQVCYASLVKVILEIRRTLSILYRCFLLNQLKEDFISLFNLCLILFCTFEQTKYA